MATLIHPVSTEKAVGMIDRLNIITYITDARATKRQIKKEFESMFAVKVQGIRSLSTQKNTKKTFIKLAAGYKASDVAVKLKLV